MIYTISGTIERDGQIIDASQAEVLGPEIYGRTWDALALAEDVARKELAECREVLGDDTLSLSIICDSVEVLVVD